MFSAVDTLLVHRLGRVAVGGRAGPGTPESWLLALDLELGALGFALSYRLRAALAARTPETFLGLRTGLLAATAAFTGADRKHEPLFRRFPEDVPEDTRALWWQKFVGFHLQQADLPCLWCDGAGATHVLSCGHVVCDRCFDGANYSACPVCERPVDRASPFFRPAPVPGPSSAPSPVPLRRLDLAGDRREETRALLTSLVARAQAMSPADVDALTTIVAEVRLDVLPWLPATIPVRQNVAIVFGTLARLLAPEAVLAVAGPHLRTATDGLRMLAVWAGASAALDPVRRQIPVRKGDTARWKGEPRRLAAQGEAALPAWYQNYARAHPGYAAQYLKHWLVATITSERFRPPKLSRAARRAVLAWLDGLPAAGLAEDLPRHRSAWIRVAEALHPGEYTDRYPRAAAGFQALRSGTPSGGFAATAERLREAGDAAGLLAHLRTRPGELWRRADDTLRHAPDPAPVIAALVETVREASLPLLLQVGTHLPHRRARWPVRVYFPAGAHFVAPSTGDGRAPLPAAVTGPVVDAIERELLARFARLPRLKTAILDESLSRVVVPFNERTAARSAVALPRGSRIDVPEADRVRLFLHWCEPGAGQTTDIDLSVAFYDDAWRLTDHCSFSNLNCHPVAVHSGDFRAAPPPAGSTEFVDVDRTAAIAAGHRYAVMLVNAYAGLPFSQLARGFAGVMRRGASDGPAFDPATVELRFDVAGDAHGTYVPLVFDLGSGTLGWLDVCHQGEVELNDVGSSSAAITRMVPALLAYFGHGVRPSMLALGQLHAAARADEVWMRGATGLRYLRRPGEDGAAFLRRLRTPEADATGPVPPPSEPALALLLRGDLALPDGSVAWALFRDGLTGTVSAADLLTVPAP